LENDYIERNYRLIENKMIEQMDEALLFGKTLIDSELNAGLFDFIVKPVLKTFYSFWSDHDAREGTLKQIKVTLDCGKILLKDGETRENFDKVIYENFKTYLLGDQTYRQCKNKHRNYNKLKEITKEAFISQVQEAAMLLSVKEDVKTYEDLCRVGFKSKEKAYESLKRQLDYNEDAIKVIERDYTILKMPTGKSIIVKILRKGFEKTKIELINRLDLIFD
jgi:hypothetical protein